MSVIVPIATPIELLHDQHRDIPHIPESRIAQYIRIAKDYGTEFLVKLCKSNGNYANRNPGKRKLCQDHEFSSTTSTKRSRCEIDRSRNVNRSKRDRDEIFSNDDNDTSLNLKRQKIKR